MKIFTKIKELWLSISLENRKRIVSFLNTFVTTFLLLLAARLETGFPNSWIAIGAMLMSCARAAVREALNLLVASK